MDIQKILAELHDERQQVNEAILSLERLQVRKNVPTVTGPSGSEGGKRARNASSSARAKIKVKTKAAGS